MNVTHTRTSLAVFSILTFTVGSFFVLAPPASAATLNVVDIDPLVEAEGFEAYSAPEQQIYAAPVSGTLEALLDDDIEVNVTIEDEEGAPTYAPNINISITQDGTDRILQLWGHNVTAGTPFTFGPTEAIAGSGATVNAVLSGALDESCDTEPEGGIDCASYNAGTPLNEVLSDFGDWTVTEVEIRGQAGGAFGQIDTLNWINIGETITYGNIQSAVEAAEPGDTISVAEGTYDFSEQLDITDETPVSIVGVGAVTVKAITDFGEVDGSKHLLAIYGGTEEEPVTISGITFDCDSKCFGLNTYNNAYGVLIGVTIKNSKGAALTANGSTIVATDLNTSGNAWGAVNVDPGAEVETPSVFTLSGGNLDEEGFQIWSDGTYVTDDATVTVTAPGYDMYSAGGTTLLFWTNKALVGVATVSSDPFTVYTSIQDAVEAADPGDTINVAEGTYYESGIEVHTEGISILGAPGVIVQAPEEESCPVSFVSAVFHLHANNVTLSGFKVDANDKCDHGIHIGDGEGIAVAGVTVSENEVYGAEYGITFSLESSHSSSSPNTAFDNEVRNSYVGILLDAAHWNTVEDNHIHDNYTGILLSNCEQGSCGSAPSNNTIVGNTIKDNGGEYEDTGIVIDDMGEGNSAHQNTIVNNGLGILNYSGIEFDAELNWWGVPNPDFEELLSGFVDAVPWLDGEPGVGSPRSANVYIDANENGVFDEEEDSFFTIRDAVESADEGDTIRVEPGVYEESGIEVETDGVSLLGAPGAVVQASDYGCDSPYPYAVFHLHADDVTLSGFKVDANSECDHGIHIGGTDGHVVSGVTVSDNEVHGAYGYGITVSWGSSDDSEFPNVISDNNVWGNDTGILLDSAHWNVVENNLIHDNFDEGILLGECVQDEECESDAPSHNTITGNTIEDNGGGDTGIVIYEMGEGNVANLNTIVENGLGVVNKSEEEFDAELNWWGVPNPVFDELIEGDVDFTPWLDDIPGLGNPRSASVYIDANGNGVFNGGEERFDRIGDAVDEADEGDIIRVEFGTYYESGIEVDEEGMSVLGAPGAIVRAGGECPSSLPYAVFHLHADGVTLSGFEVDANGECDHGIHIGGGDGETMVDSVTVSDNNVHGATYGYGITVSLGSSDDPDFPNTVSGNDVWGNEVGVLLDGAHWNLVEGNHIHDNLTGLLLGLCEQGEEVFCFPLVPPSNNTITGNTIENNGGEGEDTGIVLENIGEGNTANSNVILGNGIGILNDEEEDDAFNAESNWWGHFSGPFHSFSNSSGEGDEVDDEENVVDFDPWYINSGMTVLSTILNNVGGESGASVLGALTLAPGSGDPDSTSSATVLEDATLNIPAGGGTSSISFPAGTVISSVDGSDFNLFDLTTAGPAAGTLSGLGNGVVVGGSLQWGLTNLGLEFTPAITVNIFVGGSFNGTTLDIVRSVGGSGGWTNDGIVTPATCAVTNGFCTFQATKASFYVAQRSNTPSGGGFSSGGGGGGGGGGGAAGAIGSSAPTGGGQVLGAAISAEELRQRIAALQAQVITLLRQLYELLLEQQATR